MRRLFVGAVVAATLVSGCGGGGGSNSSNESLTDYCVRRTVEFYEQHDLPFTIPVAERPTACDKWIAQNGITTKAQIEVELRTAARLIGS